MVSGRTGRTWEDLRDPWMSVFALLMVVLKSSRHFGDLRLLSNLAGLIGVYGANSRKCQALGW